MHDFTVLAKTEKFIRPASAHEIIIMKAPKPIKDMIVVTTAKTLDGIYLQATNNKAIIVMMTAH